jgi:hypothetical protein
MKERRCARVEHRINSFMSGRGGPESLREPKRLSRRGASGLGRAAPPALPGAGDRVPPKVNERFGGGGPAVAVTRSVHARECLVRGGAPARRLATPGG